MKKAQIITRYLPGSCLFIANNLLPEHSPVCVKIENSCTSLSCLLRYQHYKVAVASVYRSPSTDILKCLEDLHGLLSQLFVSCKYVQLAGDFNIDLLHASSFREGIMVYLLIFNLFNTCTIRNQPEYLHLSLH